MKDFWISCGHHLLDRNANGGLVVTDEFLKAYFARPELMPPEDACAVERRLHRELLADPRRPSGADEIAAIADADARENWQFVLAFRDLLLRHPTLEAAYLWRPNVTEIPRWLKYVTVLGDMAFVSALIYYTGLAQSPFFFVYFVILISNCLRYGLLMSLYVALLFNVMYVVVLGLAPSGAVQPSVLGGEGDSPIFVETKIGRSPL